MKGMEKLLESKSLSDKDKESLKRMMAMAHDESEGEIKNEENEESAEESSQTSEEEISASAEALGKLDPEDFYSCKSLPESLSLDSEHFGELAKEPEGAGVMLALRGKLGKGKKGEVVVIPDSIAMLHGKLSKKGQGYVSGKIGKLMGEGREQKQSVSVALNMAKKKGYDVPKKRKLSDVLHKGEK